MLRDFREDLKEVVHSINLLFFGRGQLAEAQRTTPAARSDLHQQRAGQSTFIRRFDEVARFAASPRIGTSFSEFRRALVQAVRRARRELQAAR